MSKVLSRERARVSAWRRRSHWAGPVTRSWPRCGIPIGAVRFVTVVEKERLPISILKMDVDSDESVDAATAADSRPDREHRRAGEQCRHRAHRLDRGAGVRRLQSDDGNELLWRDPHDSSLAPGHASKAERLHRQRDLSRRTDRVLTAGAVQRIEIRAGSAQRSPRPGGQRHSTSASRLFNPGSSTQPWPDASRVHRPTTPTRRSRRFGHMFEASLERQHSQRSSPKRFARSSRAARTSCGIRSVLTQSRFLVGARR